MTGWRRRFRRAAGLVLGAIVVGMLAACASGGDAEPEEVEGRIVIGPDLNPNADGRPSPVYIRVYQLTDRDAFLDASLQDLVLRDTETLGGALLSRDGFELCPVEMEDDPLLSGGRPCQGEEREITLDINPNVRFLAVMAEFYDVNNPDTRWRAVTELPREGFWDFIFSNTFTIALERSRVEIGFDD